jgi:hypothetical protein
VKKLIRGIVCLLVAAALWLPFMHLLFRPSRDVSADVRGLCAYQTHLWTNAIALDREQGNMRKTNAEWDFMSRTYFTLALANLALREPARADELLATMDRIIDDTLRLEAEHGQLFFMMDYGKKRPFVHPEGRSIFEDGEIALMLAARRLVREKPDYREPLQTRVRFMERAMRDAPLLCAESYPDECLVFCNTVALAALRCSDVLDGTDHASLFRDWVAMAKSKLVEPRSGLLNSSFTLDGDVNDGPEGSSIWMAAHCLQIVDREFAENQYARAKKFLAGRFLGFGYAREWPTALPGIPDVDSSAVVPILGASPSSSGLALLGAAAFGDAEFLRDLRTSLNAAGFPTRTEEGLRYSASNQVGDSVLLYALTCGPLWAEVMKRGVK